MWSNLALPTTQKTYDADSTRETSQTLRSPRLLSHWPIAQELCWGKHVLMYKNHFISFLQARFSIMLHKGSHLMSSPVIFCLEPRSPHALSSRFRSCGYLRSDGLVRLSRQDSSVQEMCGSGLHHILRPSRPFC